MPVYSRVEFWRTPADTVAPWLAAPPAHGFRAASVLDRGQVAPIRCRVPAIDVRALPDGPVGGETVDSLKPYGFVAAVAKLIDRIRWVE